MKEFMLLIFNRGDSKKSFSPEKHTEFARKCEVYIERLRIQGHLISGQPLVSDGKIISGSEGKWKEVPLNEANEMQVGYYHITAGDLDEAVTIAKANPEFEYISNARIEVRPIRTKEDSTGFVYPRTP